MSKKINILFFLVVFFSFANTYGGTIPFITTWKVDNEIDESGNRGNNQITIPVAGEGYNYTVNWGDSTQTSHIGAATHKYDEAGVYTVSITGDFPRIFFNNNISSSSINRILSIDQWGDNVWKSMEGAFSGCINLKGNFTDIPNLTQVTSTSNMFFSAYSFNHDIGNWDVSNVVFMNSMFANARLFNQDISGWDVSSVTNMVNMFSSAHNFNSNIGSWDVSNVVDMTGMFSFTREFNQNINGWNVSNVINMSNMFVNARDFNQDLSNWDVSNVTNMEGMFSASSSFSNDISTWDVSNVTNMNAMFKQAVFNYDIGNWDVGNVTNMEGMFYISNFFNQDVSNWDVSRVTNMKDMFSHAQSFNRDIGNWDVGRVTNMYSMFYQAKVFNQDIGSWNVSSVNNMELMFTGANSFNQNLEKWQVGNVNSMLQIFSESNLSMANYDAILISWSNLKLQDSVRFAAGVTQYCLGARAREKIISTFDWQINDGGTSAPIINDIGEQKVSENYIFPEITGENLSGNEKYYTEAHGMGEVYNTGDIVSFDNFSSYPISIYIYDSISSICYSELEFKLSIFSIPTCSNLSMPLSGSIDVKVDTVLAWEEVKGVEGYLLSVGTTIGGVNILNDLDVGNVLNFSLTDELPEKKEIFVTITPYNIAGIPLDCNKESFTTEIKPKPPKFFTPNNDNVNDVWLVPDPEKNIMSISIYTRYGKLIKKFYNVQNGWDGTYLGKLLPKNDYWYSIHYKNGNVLKGHLSLIK